MNRAPQSYVVKRIKHYSFNTKDFLGRGNFSNVYRGINEQTNQPVAIKVKSLLPLQDPKLNQLHRSEINVLLQLNHPNVIKTYDIVQEGNQCFIFTELCQDGDIDMYVKKRGVLDENTAAKFIKDIFEGLLYLASMNIVHRDIKVANVFLNGQTTKIADFGFAVFSRQNFRDANIGSPFYMSPESFIHCIYGSKSEVWSFGILIYELFHGSSPYSSCVFQDELKRQLSVPFNRTKVRPTLSSDLKQVIYRCLQIDDQRRISLQQLKETPYFRRIYGQSEKLSFENGKNVEIQRQGILNRQNKEFIRFGSIQRNYSNQKGQKLRISFHKEPLKTEEHIQPKQQLENCQSANQFLSPNLNSSKQSDSRNNERPVSHWKKMELMPSSEPRRLRIFSKDSRKPTQKHKIINNTITFKVGVMLLHYCRCINHYIQLLVTFGQPRPDIQFMSNWLFLILEELKIKMNEDGIIFEGKNKAMKMDKFRQVRTDYERRYSDQLKQYTQNFNKPTLQNIKSFMFSQFKKYDESIVKQNKHTLLELAIFTVLIFETTRVIQSCQKHNNFSRFEKYKDLEEALTLSSESFTAPVYYEYRKRMIAY